MSDLLQAFKDVQKGKKVSEDLLIPLMRWFSSKSGNIEALQKINERFYYTNRKILISELPLNITVKGFMKYPKKPKEDYPMFFLNDLAKNFDSTVSEIHKALDVDDFESLKEEISIKFGYDDKQRKELGLDRRGLEKCRKRTRKRTKQTRL